MPKFVDVHQMKPLSGEQLRKLVREPRDEFGIVHQDILFSEKDNKALCILDAPNKEAVEKHHAKAGLKCDWIYEIETASK